jgi:hypothetical protein
MPDTSRVCAAKARALACRWHGVDGAGRLLCWTSSCLRCLELEEEWSVAAMRDECSGRSRVACSCARNRPDRARGSGAAAGGCAPCHDSSLYATRDLVRPFHCPSLRKRRLPTENKSRWPHNPHRELVPLPTSHGQNPPRRRYSSWSAVMDRERRHPQLLAYGEFGSASRGFTATRHRVPPRAARGARRSSFDGGDNLRRWHAVRARARRRHAGGDRGRVHWDIRLRQGDSRTRPRVIHGLAPAATPVDDAATAVAGPQAARGRDTGRLDALARAAVACTR